MLVIELARFDALLLDLGGVAAQLREHGAHAVVVDLDEIRLVDGRPAAGAAA